MINNDRMTLQMTAKWAETGSNTVKRSYFLD